MNYTSYYSDKDGKQRTISGDTSQKNANNKQLTRATVDRAHYIEPLQPSRAASPAEAACALGACLSGSNPALIDPHANLYRRRMRASRLLTLNALGCDLNIANGRLRLLAISFWMTS
jgi:hypothetical protein